MENSDMNADDMYITVELEDTREIIYQSPLLKPGEALSNITLGKNMDAGTYSTICAHHIMDGPDGTELSVVQMALTITVLE
jgi:hypothetical protein